MRSENLDLKDLLLDPNNYRLQDEQGFRVTAPNRFHLEQVQRATFQQLKQSGIKELHDSIVTNGFLPIERIVVTPYEHDECPGAYLVLEGNRRVAALRQIADEIDGGVDIPPEVRKTLASVPCVVVSKDEGGGHFKETLMGVRHVGGIREWGGYQRAKLIADMRNMYGLDSQEVAGKLGLSVREVNRRYRAFNALSQMREDDDYGDLGEPALYPLFHEAIAVPEVRDWLGWNNETSTFDNLENLAIFYSLITPSTSDDGRDRDAKLKSYSDVRQLKSVLPNPDAKRILLDEDRQFVDALTFANRENLSRKWREELAEATASLASIGAIEVKNFTQEDVDLLERLAAAVGDVKSIYEAINRL